MHLFSSQIFFNATMTAHKWIFIAFHKEDCKCKRHTYINLHTWKRKVLSTTHIQSFNYKDRRMCVCWMHPKNDIILFSLFSKLKIGFYRRQYFNARSVYILKTTYNHFILYYRRLVHLQSLAMCSFHTKIRLTSSRTAQLICGLFNTFAITKARTYAIIQCIFWIWALC